MTYSARDLITKAYYTSGVLSKSLQTMTGDLAKEGLDFLNEFLAVKSTTMELIPYYAKTTINTVIGQELYFVEGLLSIDNITFELTPDFRMPMNRRTRSQYFSGPRVNNVNSLPLSWRSERVKGGMNIYAYFTPDQAYPFSIIGKYALSQITGLDDNLLNYFDLFYISYLRYGVAEMICEYYNLTLQPQTSQKLKEYEQSFKSINPMDYSVQKVTAFRKGSSGFGWGDVFIGHGWRSG